MGFQPHIHAAIEQHYNINIKKIQPGPRQKMAETFILHDDRDNRYFCKRIRRPLLIPQVERSLPILREMYDQGVTKVVPPVKSRDGYSVSVDDDLLALFNYISAPQSEEYSLYALGQLMAEIHAVTPKIKAEIETEDFHYEGKEYFNTHFDKALNAKPENNVESKFQAVLKRHKENICGYIREFDMLGELNRSRSAELVITHGDAPGNVLVKSHDDLVLIDWDEIELAPAERDNWILDEYPEYMRGYRSIRPDYVIDRDLRAFCILKYFFRSFNYYFEVINDDTLSEKERLQWVNDLESNLLTGWMKPKLKQAMERSSAANARSGSKHCRIRRFHIEDLERLQAICHEAFKPVFKSFREKLGEEIYAINHPEDDREQAEYLARIAQSGSGADIFVAEIEEVIAGFVTVVLDRQKKVGTLDLNAVDPFYQGRSIGKKLYDYALNHMKEAGMEIAIVSTGGDDSHAPARRAYEKAGFDKVFPGVTMYRKL